MAKGTAFMYSEEELRELMREFGLDKRQAISYLIKHKGNIEEIRKELSKRG